MKRTNVGTIAIIAAGGLLLWFLLTGKEQLWQDKVLDTGFANSLVNSCIGKTCPGGGTAWINEQGNTMVSGTLFPNIGVAGAPQQWNYETGSFTYPVAALICDPVNNPNSSACYTLENYA